MSKTTHFYNRLLSILSGKWATFTITIAIGKNRLSVIILQLSVSVRYKLCMTISVSVWPYRLNPSIQQPSWCFLDPEMFLFGNCISKTQPLTFLCDLFFSLFFYFLPKTPLSFIKIYISWMMQLKYQERFISE